MAKPIAMVMQYSVTIPDHPGELARLTGLLADADINLYGITTINLGARVCVKFVAGKTRHMKHRLESEGYLVVESSAFRLDLGRGPDRFNALMTQLGEGGITVTSCYGHSDEQGTTLVLCVDRPDLAAPVIERCQVECANGAAQPSFA